MRSTNPILGVPALLALVALAMTAEAGPAAPGFDPKPADPPQFDEKILKQTKSTMDEFDSNKDGKLDKKELEKTRSLKRVLDKYDVDKDGCLDTNEVAAWWKDGGPPQTGVPTAALVAKRLLIEADKNRDLKLDAEELKSKNVKWEDVKKFDTNSDNALDEKELTAFLDKNPAAMMGERPGGIIGERPPHGPKGTPEEQAKRFLDWFDKDKDGKISKEEFEANPFNLAPLKDVDTNGDGYLDEKELLEALKKAGSK